MASQVSYLDAMDEMDDDVEYDQDYDSEASGGNEEVSSDEDDEYLDVSAARPVHSGLALEGQQGLRGGMQGYRPWGGGITPPIPE